MSSIAATFVASVKSVGTACTMALVGVYLHQRGFVDSPGKRTLALISQQVTFPLFLFTKIIYCDQDWSPDPCPDVTGNLRQGWILLVWPAFVVSVGLIIGRVVARLTGTPMAQRKSVLAAVAFGNSTGLPITLLTVMHKKFAATAVFGSIDPTLFLSVYLLLYPALQWGMGGWLLAPEEKLKGESDEIKHDDDSSTSKARRQSMTDAEAGNERPQYELVGKSFTRNVLNQPNSLDYFDKRKLSSNDEGIYQSETNMAQTYQDLSSVDSTNSLLCSVNDSIGLDLAQEGTEEKPLISTRHQVHISYQGIREQDNSENNMEPMNQVPPSPNSGNFLRTLQHICDRCLQPPVVCALFGMIVAMLHPIRGVFVDIIDRQSHAPLEWIFDGLYAVGQAAVPINMLILGCNLSNSYNQYTGKGEKTARAGLLSRETMFGILLGKMIVMPAVGISTVVLLRLFVLSIPDDMATSFYLVLMIVFLTPTANNVMVMVELSGSNAKEGIASVIALQYAAAPVILSITMSAAMSVANMS